MDVKTTLLNGDLKDEVYMRQPKCFMDNNQNVCKINKPIYGLIQMSLIGGILLQGYCFIVY